MDMWDELRKILEGILEKPANAELREEILGGGK